MVPRFGVALLVVLGVLLAGCTAGLDSPDRSTRPVSPSTVGPGTPGTSEPSTTTQPGLGAGGYYRAYEFTATPIDRTGAARALARSREDIERGVTWRRHPFVDDLFSAGNASRMAIDEPNADGVPGPFRNGTLVRANGTFYRLSKAVVDEHEAPAYRVGLEGPLTERLDPETYARAKREAVDFDSLAPEDRAVFTYAVPPREDRDGALTSASYRWVFPEGADPGAARLVDGDVHFVRYEGELYRVESEERDDRAVRYEVRYDLRPVATSASAFADAHLETYVTPMAETSVETSARSVLRATLRNGSVSWSGRSEAPGRFRAAATWVREHPPAGSRAYVRYDGALYEVNLQEVVE